MLAEAAMLVALSVEQGSGTEACMTFAQLKKGVERRLKRRVFVDAPEAQLRLDVRFVKTGADTEARITLASIDGAPRGSRSLVTSGHCSALDDSLALSVALLVDQPPDPEPLAGPAPPPPPPVVEAPAPNPAPALPPKRTPPTLIAIPPEVAAPREPWHVRLGVHAGGAWGVLPSVSPSALVSVTLVPRHVPPLVADAEVFLPADAERDSGSGARFRLFRAGLLVCPALIDATRVGVSWCVGQKLGWLTVEGYGFDHNRHERRFNYALTAGLEGRVRLFAPIWLRGRVGVDVPLARDRFVSGGTAAVTLFQPTPVAISGHVGVEAELW